jgi:hypothetical protein
MSTGSFLDKGIVTASVQQMQINLNSHITYMLTYPATVGYSGSEPRAITQLPTQSVGGVVVPTVGQVWPRGSW